MNISLQVNRRKTTVLCFLFFFFPSVNMMQQWQVCLTYCCINCLSVIFLWDSFIASIKQFGYNDQFLFNTCSLQVCSILCCFIVRFPGQGLFVLTPFSYYSVLCMLRLFWLYKQQLTLCACVHERQHKRERYGERGKEEWEGKEGRERNITPRWQLKTSRVPQSSVLNGSITYLGNMEIRGVIYHNLLVVNFSFGKETVGLELPKS